MSYRLLRLLKLLRFLRFLACAEHKNHISASKKYIWQIKQSPVKSETVLFLDSVKYGCWLVVVGLLTEPFCNNLL